jgi:hypothetical protein
MGLATVFPFGEGGDDPEFFQGHAPGVIPTDPREVVDD